VEAAKLADKPFTLFVMIKIKDGTKEKFEGQAKLAAAASLDAYCIPLHKGTPIEMRQQLLTQFKQWLVEHPLKEAVDPTPVVSSPTGIFLSL
jgi:hypothetical protein